MTTTIQLGDRFRDSVAALLRTQFPDVATEQLISGTKVDITFTEHQWTKTHLVAVECKNYENALTKADLETIFNKYFPMVRALQVRRVLVISRRPISAAAEGYLDALPEFTHMTLDVLGEELFGIRSIVEQLTEIKNTNLNPYIQPRFEEQTLPAFDAIDAWLDNPDEQALAILGGYGQGKTSLAVQVAARAAENYLSDQTNRIPILIRLGEVVHETQLEGLFGKEFTSKHNIPRYRFDTLMHLNLLGRLLIILDGFDEMKHAMSGHDFEANFKEFNRLLVGRSKVMLLGRPSALPSEERDLVFRGRKKINGVTIKSPHFKPWLEWRLSFFFVTEAKKLLLSVLTLTVANERPIEWISTRTSEVMQHVPHDLLRRPVHVVLIAEAAGDPSFDFEGFNEHALYSHFVTEMVRRDQVGKRTRREIPLENRLKFQRDLAWWAWARAGVSQGSFYRDDVPQDLLVDHPDGGSTDFDSKRNEYIVSTLTDEKESGVLYFSHRSFQEFLVAERMTLHGGPGSHALYSRYLNNEISNFISLTPDQSFLDRLFETLNENSGPLSFSYLDIFARSQVFTDRLWQQAHSSQSLQAPATLIFLLAFLRGTMPKNCEAQYLRLLRDEIEAGNELSAGAAVLSYLSMSKMHAGNAAEAGELVSSVIVRALNIDAANRVGSQLPGTELLVPIKLIDYLISWISQDVERKLLKTSRVLSWNMDSVSTLWDLTVKCLEKSLLIGSGGDAGWECLPIRDDAIGKYIEVPMSIVLNHIPSDARSNYSKFLSAADPHFKVVGTERRGTVNGRRRVGAAFSTNL